MILVAPSGGGKTVTLVSLLVDLLRTDTGRPCFSRIYVISPSINLDARWRTLKEYQRDVMRVPAEENDELHMEIYEEPKLQDLVDRQRKITEQCKKLNMQRLFGVAFVFDDIADSPAIARYSRPLHELFVRGRHYGCTTICSVQSYKVLHPLIRRNATGLCVCRLRNGAGKKAILEEQSAIHHIKILEQAFDVATEAPHSFLYINLSARDKNDLLWEGFSTRLVLKSAAEPP